MKNRAKNRALTIVPIVLGTILFGAVASLSPADAQTNNAGSAGVGNAATGAGSDAGVSGAIEQKPLLTPAQRSAIYAEVSKDTSKISPMEFSAVIGADVPPMSRVLGSGTTASLWSTYVTGPAAPVTKPG